MSVYGTLYGIGVGPGDPELLTLKAARILGEVGAVFAASSSKNDHSIAQAIVAPHLAPDVPVLRLAFPMRNGHPIADARGAETFAFLKHTQGAFGVEIGPQGLQGSHQ